MQPNSNPARRSAAGIVVPKTRLSAPKVEDRLGDIRDMLDGCGPNRNDHAIVAIIALITNGVDTGPQIVAALEELGFNKQHAGLTLRKGTGDQPDRHWWSKDEAGRYTLLS